jgi:hypothetical protein
MTCMCMHGWPTTFGSSDSEGRELMADMSRRAVSCARLGFTDTVLVSIPPLHVLRSRKVATNFFVYGRRMSAVDAVLTNARAAVASLSSRVTSASACSWVSAMYSAW